MADTLRYLTTLDLDDEWLDALSKRCPGLEIRRIPATSTDDIDDGVWAATDVLHTDAVFPLPSQAPQLRWIQLNTSGIEHVAAHPIWTSGLTVTTLGGIAPVPMAEFTLMSLLGLAHHQPMLEEHRRRRSWPPVSERMATMTPLAVDGATAVIVGYGRIGREVGRLLHAFGVNVIGVSRRGHAHLDAEDAPLLFDTGRSPWREATVEHRSIDQLAEALPQADYLIIIVPRTPASTGLVGADELAQLKPGSCVINVSRGGIVDEAALLAALRSRHVTYAALDVFDDEPLPADSVWWNEPHCLITPHVAGLAPRYLEQVLALVSTNIVRFSQGEPLLNRADRAAGY